MKQSNTWYALILIASALLLNAARSATAESPSQQNQGRQAETSAQEHNAIADPTASTINQQTSKPTPTSGATYIYNQYQQSSPWGDFPTWLEAIASIGLAIFAFWQINFVKRTTTASENAAEAARDAVRATQQYVELTKELSETTKQSVELARLSLSTERPYITVTPVGLFPSASGARVNLALRNDGSRPAIIKNIYAHMAWEQRPDCPPLARRQELAGHNSRRIHEYVIGSNNRTSREYSLWYADAPPELRMDEPEPLLHALYDQREQSNRELHIFGFVIYADPADNRYMLEFCWSAVSLVETKMDFYLDIFIDRVVNPPEATT